MTPISQELKKLEAYAALATEITTAVSAARVRIEAAVGTAAAASKRVDDTAEHEKPLDLRA